METIIVYAILGIPAAFSALFLYWMIRDGY
jgi:hypothetical protein